MDFKKVQINEDNIEINFDEITSIHYPSLVKALVLKYPKIKKYKINFSKTNPLINSQLKNSLRILNHNDKTIISNIDITSKSDIYYPEEILIDGISVIENQSIISELKHLKKRHNLIFKLISETKDNFENLFDETIKNIQDLEKGKIIFIGNYQNYKNIKGFKETIFIDSNKDLIKNNWLSDIFDDIFYRVEKNDYLDCT